MSDAIYKLSILRWMLLDTLSSWHSEVWRKDLDSRICCDGRECGCYGATLREIYTPSDKEENGNG